MKIVVLIENTEGQKGCKIEHGLSLYIETRKHRLLVDTGATDAFISNADKLQVELDKIDTVVLSHGHYDHSGGIMGFSQINNTAKIYMHKLSGGDYYHKNETLEKYIGIDKDILKLSQVELVEGNLQIDDELTLFGGVSGSRFLPPSNRELMSMENGIFVPDEFHHEQYLVISQDSKKILVSGCAHRGIINILDEYRDIYGGNPDIVISGFHLQNKAGYTPEDVEIFKEIAVELSFMETKFYTGHCTGEFPFEIMKEIMGDKLVYIHSGDVIND